MIICVATLKVVACSMPKNDCRKVLNGVYCEKVGDSITLTATDGRVMNSITYKEAEAPGGNGRWSYIVDESEGDWDIIIPGDAVKEILKHEKKLKGVVQLERGANALADLWRSGICVYFTPIDGRYPNYRMVIPESTFNDPSTEVVSVTLSAATLPAIANMAKRQSGYHQNVTLYMQVIDGNIAARPIILAANGQRIGLVMPVKTETDVDDIFPGRKTKEKEAAA